MYLISATIQTIASITNPIIYGMRETNMSAATIVQNINKVGYKVT